MPRHFCKPALAASMTVGIFIPCFDVLAYLYQFSKQQNEHMHFGKPDLTLNS